MKTNTQHTPGPWTQLNKGEGTLNDIVLRADNGSDERRVCTIHNDPEHANPEVDANARLIAAAPALLEALKAVCAFSVIPKLSDDSLSRMACGDALTARDDTARIGYTNTPFRDNAHALKQAIEQARAAIAQAEGGDK